MPLDLNRVDQIVEALGAMLRRRAIARELENLRHLAPEPEDVDALLRAAIHAGLAAESGNSSPDA